MSQTPRVRALAGGLALIASLALVGGCGDDGGSVSVKTDQGTVSADKGDVSVQTDQGTVTAGKDLPDGFPADEVPLIADAKVVAGTRGAPGGQFAWSVVMQTPRALDDVTAEMKKDFDGAGYTVGQANEMGDLTILQFKGTAYDVSVTAARTGDGITVTYLVKAAS